MMVSGKYDMEELLKARSFADLDPEEKAFVLQHVESEEEYERMRRMMPLLSESTVPEMEAGPDFRETLLAVAAEESEKKNRVIPMAWYRKTWLMYAATGIAASFLLAMIWFSNRGHEDIITDDGLAQTEQVETPVVPDIKTEPTPPEKSNDSENASMNELDIPEGLIAEELSDVSLDEDADPVPTAIQNTEFLSGPDLLAPSMQVQPNYTSPAGAFDVNTYTSGSATNLYIPDSTVVVYNWTENDDFSGNVARTGNAMSPGNVLITDSSFSAVTVTSSNARLFEESTMIESESIQELAVVSSKRRKASSVGVADRKVKPALNITLPSRSLALDVSLLPILYTAKGN